MEESCSTRLTKKALISLRERKSLRLQWSFHSWNIWSTLGGICDLQPPENQPEHSNGYIFSFDALYLD